MAQIAHPGNISQKRTVQAKRRDGQNLGLDNIDHMSAQDAPIGDPILTSGEHTRFLSRKSFSEVLTVNHRIVFKAQKVIYWRVAVMG